MPMMIMITKDKYVSPSCWNSVRRIVCVSISYSRRKRGLQSAKLGPRSHLLVLDPSVSFPLTEDSSCACSSSLELSNSD
jgi:hypothetical protein